MRKETDKDVHYTPDGKEIDFFSRTPPGYSLTQPPKKFPWDKPPIYTDPEEAYSWLEKNMYKEESILDIIDLLEMEMSPTLIAQSILTMGYAKGLWNPDIAELIKPAIITDIVVIGAKAEIDINFGNEDVYVDYKKMNKEIDTDEDIDIEENISTTSSVQPETEVKEIQKMLDKKGGLMSKVGE